MGDYERRVIEVREQNRWSATHPMHCPQCDFTGTDAEVDEHRASGIHNDQPQAGSNERQRRR